MDDLPESLLHKILSAQQFRQRDWNLSRPLVFTNGVFDLLHRGHVVNLARARALGANLLIGLNADESARRLGKGSGRPVNREEDRALLLAALQSVSYVTLFNEATPCELLKLCRPDVYVKGSDYDVEALEESRLVRSWGGRALALPLVQGYSSTSLLERLRDVRCP